MRLTKVISQSLLAAGALLAATSMPAAASAAPAGGAISFYVVQGPGPGSRSTVVVSGAIGGRGSALYVDKDGSADPGGSYAKVTIGQGTGAGATFEVDLVAFLAKAATESFPIDKAACTSTGSITAPAVILAGTGPYEGIAGTVEVVEHIVWTMPRDASGPDKGQCDGPKAQSFMLITGTGRVSFH